MYKVGDRVLCVNTRDTSFGPTYGKEILKKIGTIMNVSQSAALDDNLVWYQVDFGSINGTTGNAIWWLRGRNIEPEPVKTENTKLKELVLAELQRKLATMSASELAQLLYTIKD